MLTAVHERGCCWSHQRVYMCCHAEGQSRDSEGPHDEDDSVEELEEAVNNLKEQCASVRHPTSKVCKQAKSLFRLCQEAPIMLEMQTLHGC